MDRRFQWVILFLVFLPFRSVGDDSLALQESDESLEPGFWITLDETIQRATSRDSAVASHSSNWRADDARVEDILASGGWEMEVLARADRTGGDRRETRNTSLGRSLRDVSGKLDEDEKFLELALVKEFWDEPRQKKDDVAEERITQLDRVTPWMTALNAVALVVSKAYLDVYYGRLIEDLNRQQAELLSENLRVLRVRQAQSEALAMDVLDAEQALAELDKERDSIQLKTSRQLEILRRCWEMEDLASDELALPEISAGTGILNTSLEAILDRAQSSRPDVRAAELALATHRGARGVAASRPELEFKLAGRVGDMDRDWTDEGREDSTYEAQAELRLTYPLSQRRRNAAKLKRHSLQANAMYLQLESLRSRVSTGVTEAYDAAQVFRGDLRIQEIQINKAEELDRLTRLQAETMPEALGSDPQSEVRTVSADLLAEKTKYLKLERDATQARIELLAEIGELTHCPIPRLGFGW